MRGSDRRVIEVSGIPRSCHNPAVSSAKELRSADFREAQTAGHQMCGLAGEKQTDGNNQTVTRRAKLRLSIGACRGTSTQHADGIEWLRPLRQSARRVLPGGLTTSRRTTSCP